MLTSTFLDDVKEWSGPFFEAQQLGVRLNFDVDVKSAVQTDEVEVDVTQCENRFSPESELMEAGTGSKIRGSLAPTSKENLAGPKDLFYATLKHTKTHANAIFS